MQAIQSPLLDDLFNCVPPRTGSYFTVTSVSCAPGLNEDGALSGKAACLTEAGVIQRNFGLDGAPETLSSNAALMR